jgi:hypothetical protein
MRVLLAGPDVEENLSIRYLASSLQAKRHEASLAVFNSADDVEAVAEQAGEAEIVGLSVCFQSRAQEFPLDIPESVEGLSDLENTEIVEQNLLLHEGSGVWYFEHNYDVGVLPTSFCEDGSREHLL